MRPRHQRNASSIACRASECDAHAPTPKRNPKSYRRPLLLVSYTRTLGLIKLIQNISGAIMPCHNPAQKPAGVALGNLYFEFGPAIASMLAMRHSTIAQASNLLDDRRRAPPIARRRSWG